MQELQLINQEFTKSQIKLVADNLIQNLLDKGGNVLDVAKSLANASEFIDLVRKNPDFIDYVRTEVSKYGKEYKSDTGTKIELFDSAKNNFENCGDAEWEMLNQQLASIKQQISDREKFLKSLPESGEEIVCKITGEIKKVYPPYKTYNSTYKITIAK